MCLALQNMYKLLKPTHIGINYMVEKLQDYISRIGHEKVQSLKGENVRRENEGNFLDEYSRFSYRHYSWILYLNYIRNTAILSKKHSRLIRNLSHHWIKLVRLL